MDKQQKIFFRLLTTHGSGDSEIVITPKEVFLLLHVACKDLKINADWFKKDFLELAKKDFFEISFEEMLALEDISADECYDCLDKSGATNVNNILWLYLKNLCDLHRRRFKFDKILQEQPFPNIDQIGPRALLEFGQKKEKLLADWLTWRKWIYDIDNRSAQETGYIFEPLLASCLGGISVSSKTSPIRRRDDNGEVAEGGRQIDCYLEEEREAYELKMRVTIAASGQGRVKEELSFPYEAWKAGITPKLVVFDGTSSPILDKLQREYLKYGGCCYIGDDAWRMLIDKAGKEMGLFIEKYIKPPISSMGEEISKKLGDLQLHVQDKVLKVSSGNLSFLISRK